MKRIVLCLLLSILLLPVRGSAESKDSTEFDLKALAEDTVFLATLDDPYHAVLGLERNADKKRYPASTTKIMTCIIALERCDPYEMVTVGKRAVNLSARNSKMGLKAGEQYPMIDLLYGLMLPSGNDAAIAIAEHVGGSISGFADLMNAKAKQLGMEHSHFLNPHGLHNSDHYTTARDMALLTAYAMENETFREIVASAEYTAKSEDGRKIELRSSNRLLRDVVVSGYTPYSCLYPYAIGVKTGDTHLAGKCLVAAARRNDTTYILVLLHGEEAPSGTKGRAKDKYAAQRFLDAIDLFEYVFAHDTVTVDAKSLIERCLPESYAVRPDPAVSYATEALYRIEWDRTESLTLLRWQADVFQLDPFPGDLITYTIDLPNAAVGTKAGTAVITVSGTVVFTGDLIVEEYTYPPTPAPTEVPTYVITDETPSPGPSSDGASPTEMIPITTDKPDSEWSWNLFGCGPHC